MNVQAVFFPDNLQAASRFFASFSETARAQIYPLGSVNWDNSVELQQSHSVLDGAIFVSPFFSRSERPEIQQFMNSYQAKYQLRPDFLAAQGFDAATIALEALRRSVKQEINVSDALTGIDLYDGLTGRVLVQPSGELQRTFTVLQLRQGAAVELTAKQALKSQDVQPQSVN